MKSYFFYIGLDFHPDKCVKSVWETCRGCGKLIFFCIGRLSMTTSLSMEERDVFMMKYRETEDSRQRIIVFQQHGSGERKIHGVRKYGGDLFLLDIFSIDSALPSIINDSSEYLPERLNADLVVDYLKHPDLSIDLAHQCETENVPVIASGKKTGGQWVFNPPT